MNNLMNDLIAYGFLLQIEIDKFVRIDNNQHQKPYKSLR